MKNQPARIEVNIGEIVLHGFPAEQRGAIADGVKSELTLMLNRDGLPPKQFQGVKSDRPATQIAQAIYRKIGGEI